MRKGRNISILQVAQRLPPHNNSHILMENLNLCFSPTSDTLMVISGWHPLCHDLAKWLSYYLYFFSFLFLLDLLHKKGVWESIT